MTRPEEGDAGAAVLIEPPEHGVVDVLEQAGWSVLQVGRGRSIAQVWNDAPAARRGAA